MTSSSNSPRMHLGRSRSAVLDQVIPVVLGLLSERGRPVDATRRFVDVEIDSRIEIGGFVLDDGIIHLHIYAFVDGDWAKVFSAYLSHYPRNDRRYKYCARRCSILSWKRGQWELVVAAQNVAPRSIEQVAAEGLTRNQPL